MTLLVSISTSKIVCLLAVVAANDRVEVASINDGGSMATQQHPLPLSLTTDVQTQKAELREAGVFGRRRRRKKEEGSAPKPTKAPGNTQTNRCSTYTTHTSQGEA